MALNKVIFLGVMCLLELFVMVVTRKKNKGKIHKKEKGKKKKRTEHYIVQSKTHILKVELLVERSSVPC